MAHTPSASEQGEMKRKKIVNETDRLSVHWAVPIKIAEVHNSGDTAGANCVPNDSAFVPALSPERGRFSIDSMFQDIFGFSHPQDSHQITVCETDALESLDGALQP